jgi:hypothetical protein
MLYYVALYCTILNYTIRCYATLCYATLYCNTQQQAEPLSNDIIKKKISNVRATYNVKLRDIRVTVVATETQQHVSFVLLLIYLQMSTTKQDR